MSKFLLVFSIILVSHEVSGQASLNKSLQIADSLFEEKRFTESLEIYESIQKTGESSSPQMLLKMAYIHEGLNDIDKAQYFLNLYYEQTLNRDVLVKMNELAKKNELIGYDLSDQQYFLTSYKKYQSPILISLLIVSLLIFANILYTRFVRKRKSMPGVIALVIILGLLFYVNNLGDVTESGITHSNDTYIMLEPSSGSKLVEVVGSGHKVTILDRADVWYKVTWDDQEGFIRENDLLLIHS